MENLREIKFNVKKLNELDSEGFMTIEGIVAVADKVLEYVDWWSETVTREVIPIEELEKSRGALVGVVVTNSHPWEMIDSKNATHYTKGMIIEDLGISDNKLNVRARLIDSNLITDVQSGKDSISMGYYCDMESSIGVTNSGESYTHIQKNIRWNHMGIVDNPREDEAKITKFNSKDHNLAFERGLYKLNSKGDGKVSVFKFNGKDMSAEEVYAEAVRLNSVVSEVTSAKEKLEGELAVEKNNSKTLEEKLNSKDSEMEAKINSKIELISIASEIVKDKDLVKMNEIDIKRAVINSVNPGLDITGMSDATIEGAYLATMSKLNSAEPQQAIVTDGAIKNNSSDDLHAAVRKLRGGK